MTPHSFIKSDSAKYFILLIVTVILYYKTIYFELNLDDYIIFDAITTKSGTLKEVLSIFKLAYNKTDYRPIVMLSYGFEQYLFGEIRPSVSHGINVSLFLFICITALSLFKLLFGKKHQTLLFLSVLLYCVHPLNTEVVCSLKCRDNLLSMLFGLLAFYSFVHFMERQNKRILFCLLFIFFSVTAILSKMDALGFLALCLAYVFFTRKENKLLYLSASIAIVLFITSLTTFIKDAALSQLTFEDAYKGIVTFTENPLAMDFSIQNRCIAFVNTIYYYFTKMIPMSSYRYYYGYNYYAVLSASAFSFFGGLVIIIGFIFALIAGLKNRDKILIVSVSAVFILSLYALNFITPVAGIIADRYIFMANLYFCLLLTYSIYLVFQLINKSVYLNYILYSIIILFMARSMLRIPAWKNLKTLIDTDAPELYTSYEAMRIAAGAYGKEYDKEKDDNLRKSYLEKSIFYAEKGVRVYPKNYLLYLFLGQYYFENKQANDAIRCFKTSLKNDSSTVNGFVYLGDTYYSLKKMDSALFYYKRGLEINTKSQLLINNISTIYYELNDKQECLKFNNYLIEEDSTTFAAQENLGYFYLNERDTLKAKEYFRKALKFGLDEESIPLKTR